MAPLQNFWHLHPHALPYAKVCCNSKIAKALHLMEEIYIQSLQNNQVKNLVKLRERKYRERQSCCLIEGLREIGHALNAGLEITHLYYCNDFFRATYTRNLLLNTKMQVSSK